MRDSAEAMEIKKAVLISKLELGMEVVTWLAGTLYLTMSVLIPKVMTSVPFAPFAQVHTVALYSVVPFQSLEHTGTLMVSTELCSLAESSGGQGETLVCFVPFVGSINNRNTI